MAKSKKQKENLAGYNGRGNLMDLSPAPSEIDEMLKEEAKDNVITKKYGENVEIIDEVLSKVNAEPTIAQLSGITDCKTAEKAMKNVLKKTVDQCSNKQLANDLTKQRLKKLFRMFCIYRIDPQHDKSAKCSGCILRDIPWTTSKGQIKDLCYAIWYEDILNG